MSERKLYRFDKAVALEHGAPFVGVDEAGRGPLAGPVVAGAVELDLTNKLPGLDDSKKVPPTRRLELFDAVTSRAKAWAVGIVSHEEIDRINILQASLLAMKRALDNLGSGFSLVLVDGNTAIPTLPREAQRPIVGGDAQSASIAAASIVAKVTRDRIMTQYHAQYPEYEFDLHKGYATARHRELILAHGLCPIHRRSFCSLYLQTELPLDS